MTWFKARDRSPYTIPVPDPTVIGGDLQEVWVSREGTQPEFFRVYLIYSNELEVSIGGRPDEVDYTKRLTGSTRPTRVRGIPAGGRDPFVKTTNEGFRVAVPAVLSWWVNRVNISLYHPTLPMAQLEEVAEGMSNPEWAATRP